MSPTTMERLMTLAACCLLLTATSSLSCSSREGSHEECVKKYDEDVAAENEADKMRVSLLQFKQNHDSLVEPSRGEVSGSTCPSGCGTYVPHKSCQCTPKCEHYHNCCGEYWSKCKSQSTNDAANCKGTCGTYRPGSSCQCTEKCHKYGNCCGDYSTTCGGGGGHHDASYLSDCGGMYAKNATFDGSAAPCLCLFDIDRTLTGKQGDTQNCPRNKKTSPYVHDSAYGGGQLTWSALGAEGLANTFCNRCYTGVVSAGSGSNDQERNDIVQRVLTTEKQRELAKAHPSAQQWDHGYIPRGGSVKAPYVKSQSDKKKQYAVNAVQKWFDSKGVCIPSYAIHFFGDRTENMAPFGEYAGFNAREISCKSRDKGHRGMIGYCGGTPEEIVETAGIATCDQQR